MPIVIIASRAWLAELPLAGLTLAITALAI